MRVFVRPFAALAIIAGGALAVAALQNVPAFAQATKQPAPAQPQAAPAPAAPADAAQPKEIALTDKQIEEVLASQKEFDAIAAKIPQTQNADAKPDPKVIAQFEDVAKKHGFASYAEYNDAVETISLVLGGFDPKTKTYVGPEAVLKQQIAAVQADKKMPAKDKKATLDEMDAMLKSPPPPLQNKGNIDLVAKYYDKLAAAMSEDE